MEPREPAGMLYEPVRHAAGYASWIGGVLWMTAGAILLGAVPAVIVAFAAAAYYGGPGDALGLAALMAVHAVRIAVIPAALLVALVWLSAWRFGPVPVGAVLALGAATGAATGLIIGGGVWTVVLLVVCGLAGGQGALSMRGWVSWP